MAAAAFVVASCSSKATTEENEEVVVEAVTYTLDKENSSINWKGGMSADYFHSGTVGLSEGSVTVEGESVTGSFTVDMTSIDDTSLEAPKSDYLSGHLQGTMVDEDHPADLFFNTPLFPNVNVTVNSYKDGKLDLTLDILGKQVNQTVDAAFVSNEEEASVKGSFSLDLSSLNVPGFGVNADGSQISPMIEFEVVVALKK